MNVAFRLVREFVVEDVRDARDVDAARGDIGGDQHLELTRPETPQRPLTLALAAVAVDGINTDTFFAERFRQLVRSELGAGENKSSGHLRLVQQGAEQVALELLVHHQHALFDALDRFGFRSNLHSHRIVEQSIHQVRHPLGHRCRKEHVLPRFGEQCSNPLDLREKTDVQHTVGLVEYQHFHVPQENVALFHVITQASGCGNQDLNSVLKHATLRRQTHSAIDHPTGQPKVPTQLVDHGVHLHGKLAGRDKDQRSRTLALGNTALCRQAVQQRKHECGGLAGAGLRDAQQVMPVE